MKNSMPYLLVLLLWATGLHANTLSEKVVSGILLYNKSSAPDLAKAVATLPGSWYVTVDSLKTTEKTAVFSTPGATVMISWLDYPATPADLQMASAISWLWKDAEKETAKHKSQILISVLGNQANTLNLYRTFTKIAAGITSALPDVSGVYMNDQYLVLSSGYYVEAARNMGGDGKPLYCWVYFGLLQFEEKSGCYSYGLSEFGQNEIEWVDSTLPLQEAHALFYEICQAAAGAGKPWKDGEQIELSDGRKVKLTLSDAKYIGEGGKTLKVSL